MSAFVITGIPGTGKTTVAKILQDKGIKVYSLFEFAKEHNCLDKYDKRRDSWIIDDHKLILELTNYLSNQDKSTPIGFEGHYGDLVPSEFVTKCFVLEASTRDLEERLKTRNYSPAKIRENLDAQIFRECYYDAIEHFGEDTVITFSSTDMSATEIASKILNQIL